MVKCKNIVNILNNLYNSEKILLEEDCLKKNHKYKPYNLKIKLPDKYLLELKLKKTDSIFNKLAFVFSNIDNKNFKNKKENEHAFNLLILILAIIDDYRLASNMNSEIINDKSIINDMIPFIKMDKYYKFILPHNIEYKFKVSGFKLAVMKSKKLL